jgi:hypothetical protein
MTKGELCEILAAYPDDAPIFFMGVAVTEAFGGNENEGGVHLGLFTEEYRQTRSWNDFTLGKRGCTYSTGEWRVGVCLGPEDGTFRITADNGRKPDKLDLLQLLQLLEEMRLDIATGELAAALKAQSTAVTQFRRWANPRAESSPHLQLLLKGGGSIPKALDLQG